MNQALALRTATLDMSHETLAQHFVKSGFFKDAADVSKAIVKIVYGAEVGLPPVTSMMGIHIIQGRPAYSANLLATLVKKSGRYNYRVAGLTAQVCRIEFIEAGQLVGVSEFTIAEAQTAGLASKDTWKQYPKAMLFSRAMSQGVRWYCPDVTGGAPAYTPEELGAAVTEDGEVIEGTASGAPLRAVARSAPAGPEDSPVDQPKRPHPEAEDTGDTYHGDTVWQVGGVVCLEQRKANGSRYLASTERCPQHNTWFYLSPDGAADAWAHGTGAAKCERAFVLRMASAEGDASL